MEVKWLSKLRDDRGSLSIVIIGLFVVTVASLMIMTDVATVMVAKRSLTQATEAAAMRGVHTLDRASYYTGKGTMATTPLALINNREHPKIPIDCNQAVVDVMLELHNWSTDDSSMKRQELQGIVLTDFICDGTSVEISTYFYIFQFGNLLYFGQIIYNNLSNIRNYYLC